VERKMRSDGTIAGYADHVERLLGDWLDRPLRELGDEPSLVSKRHDDLTASSGPYAANGCMRTLRAIYNHARKSVRGLPPENPVTAVDWNEETRRDVAMGTPDIAGWMTQAGRLRNAIRREFHLFTLLSGSRPTALKTARVPDLNFGARVLRITKPKGGVKKAFDIPLSRPMICCLIRAMRISRMLHPEAAETYIFASAGAEGHLVEHKEDREADLAKWGNDLRHTYRTLGQAAGLSGVDMHLLTNHSVKGVNVNEGYITRSKLLNDHLRSAQQRLSDHIIAGGTAAPSEGLVKRPTKPEKRAQRARRFALRLVPDISFLCGVLSQVATRLAEQAGFEGPAPMVTFLPSLVRHGCDTPYHYLIRRSMDFPSRPAVQTRFESIADQLKREAGDDWNLVREKVDRALTANLFENLAAPDVEALRLAIEADKPAAQ
jgi:hypothetical protein